MLDREENCRNCGAPYKHRAVKCDYCLTDRPISTNLFSLGGSAFEGYITTTTGTGGAWPTYNHGEPFSSVGVHY